MEVSAIISWKDKEVGKVSNIINDMWYFEGDWLPAGSDHSSKFIDIAGRLNAKEVMESPTKGLLAFFYYGNSSSDPQKVLILSLDNSKIFMRIVSDETAAYVDLSLMEPWEPIENPIFYENELKKEVTFFHPLNWKKVRAIGKRPDCDDVLYEALTGNSKFAVVHLTYSKSRSYKFPITEFYTDWTDLYKSRLLKDHEEWNGDLDEDKPNENFVVQKFEIMRIHGHPNRGHFIFARLLDFKESIKVNEGALLNGIPVYHYLDMYPTLDK